MISDTATNVASGQENIPRSKMGNNGRLRGIRGRAKGSFNHLVLRKIILDMTRGRRPNLAVFAGKANGNETEGLTETDRSSRPFR